MNAFIRRRLFALHTQHPDPISYYRAIGLIRVILFMMTAWVFWVVVTTARALLGVAPLAIDTILILLIVPFVLGIIFRLTERGDLNRASWLFTGMLFTVSVPVVIDTLDGSTVVFLFLPVISAALLQGRRGALAALFMSGLLLVAGAVLQSRLGVETTSDILINLSLLVMVFGLGVLFLYAFAGNIQNAMDQSLLEIEQFKTAGDMVVQASQQDEYSLLADFLIGLRDRMGFRFTQFFLADDTEQLNRRLRLGLASGEPYSLIEIAVGDVSPLTEAARTRKPVVVTSADPEVRRSHFLPSSRYGAAIPVILHDHLIGVLDVQATEERISSGYLDVLVTFAGQMAVRFQDVRTMNSMRQILNEQEQANEALRTQLREVRQAERQLTSLVWDTYLDRRGQQAIGFDLDVETQALIPAHDLPESLRPAYQSHELRIEEQGDQQVLMVPVILREEVIGSMAFSIPAGENITERQKDVALNVANRLALALDNRRLFEQSQSQVVRERKANEIVNLLIGATDVDAVMSLAASSFNEALGAISTRVYLQADVLSTQSVSAVDDTPAQNGEGRR